MDIHHIHSFYISYNRFAFIESYIHYLHYGHSLYTFTQVCIYSTVYTLYTLFTHHIYIINLFRPQYVGRLTYCRPSIRPEPNVRQRRRSPRGVLIAPLCFWRRASASSWHPPCTPGSTELTASAIQSPGGRPANKTVDSHGLLVYLAGYASLQRHCLYEQSVCILIYQSKRTLSPRPKCPGCRWPTGRWRGRRYDLCR